MDGRVEGEEVKAAGHAARLTILFEVGGEGNVLGRLTCYLVLYVWNTIC